MDKAQIKAEAAKYIDNEAPYWLRAESEDRESSIEVLTDFAERMFRHASIKLERKCYCGNPVDTSNPDCDAFNLCKEHADDC